MSRPRPDYHGYRFPPQIISHAVWLYHRFSLSFRDVEDLLAERGVSVTYETIRQWCLMFGLDYARRLRRSRGWLGDTWYLDEVFVKIQGRQQYLWHVVQSRRNRRAAERFFRKLLKGQGSVPRRLITDKLHSYPAARRTIMPSVVHCTDQYANNRAKVSHQPTRQRERRSGLSPADPVRGRSPELGHAVQDVARDRGFRLLSRPTVRSKTVTNDRLEPEERVFHAGLVVVSGSLLPPSPTKNAHPPDSAVATRGPGGPCETETRP
jgi:putative transposase